MIIPHDFVSEIYWKVNEFFRGKSKIVDQIADAIPELADKIAKAKEELDSAQYRYDYQVENKNKLEEYASQIGYEIDWAKKAIIKK